ncbi:MAG: Mth938-like domain-containing protein [Anaerolineae bacterium]
MTGPRIDDTGFGWIEVAGTRYDHDLVIELDGTVRKRKKRLSKKVYGTSHRLSLKEAENVYEEGTELLLVGSGQFGRVRLSDEAQAFFDERGVTVTLLRTPEAIRRWNALQTASGERAVVGLFHITC